MRKSKLYPLFPLSNLTIIFSFLIILSAAVMRQLFNFLNSMVGREGVVLLVWITFALIAYQVLKYLWKRDRISTVLAAGVIALGLFYAWTLEIREERVHLIYFGVLGCLATRDLFPKYKFHTFYLSIFYCLIIAFLDEVFQYYLPNRVGEVRDVLFAIPGSIWGTLLYYITTEKLKDKS